MWRSIVHHVECIDKMRPRIVFSITLLCVMLISVTYSCIGVEAIHSSKDKNNDEIANSLGREKPHPLLINNWTSMDKWISPPLRHSHSMVYDSISNRVVLFGGWPDLGAHAYNDTWSYDYDNNTWTDMNPSASPSQRHSSPLAYDTKHDRVILFGGGTLGNLDNFETWSYNYNSNSWKNISPSSHPSTGSGAAMVYDTKIDKSILFGGCYGGGTRLNVTWAYDYNNNTWIELKPLISPPPTYFHAMAYDSESDRIIVFGGDILNTINDETWAYDYLNNTWENMTSSIRPFARVWHSMTYDAIHDRIILFGGYDTESYFNDTWAYDYNSNIWTNMSAQPAPFFRWGHALAYDSKNDRTILFGGFAGDADSDETWSYDYNGNKWVNLDAWLNPSPRDLSAMVYDSKDDRIILFGGFDGRGLDDTWAYDYTTNTWMNLNPNKRPEGRGWHTMAYDIRQDRIILFGGADTGNIYYDDTWSYDYRNNTWTNMSPTIHPNMRFESAMAYDSQSDKTILFGGWSVTDVYDDETWSYDYGTNTWVNITGLFRPSGRNSHGMIYDSRSDQIILYGGRTSSFHNDETWAYNYDSDTWTNRSPSSKPSHFTIGPLAYDLRSDKMIIFGGTTDLNETWAYDYDANMWANMNPINSPDSRQHHAMAYDSKCDIIILFGGETFQRRFADDTWAYELDIVVISSPTIISTSPNNGTTAAPINTNVSLFFSDSMDTTATENAFSILPAIIGKYSWDSSEKNMSFKPDVNLSLDTKYTVTISTSVKSKVGLNMQVPYTFLFTTISEPPKIVSTSPSNGQKDVDKVSKISITFDRPMDLRSTEDAASIVPGSILGFEWNNGNRTLALSADLEGGKTYIVIISGMAKDASGNAMSRDYTFTFTTKGTQVPSGPEPPRPIDPMVLVLILVPIIALIFALGLFYLRRKR